MKQNMLVLLLLIVVFNGFSQIYDSKPDALKNIEDGKVLLSKGNITKAIEKFSFAIDHGAEKSALILRAGAYLKLADTCNSCNDYFGAAKLLKDTSVFNQFKKNCLTFDTIRSYDNSLLIEYPKYNYTLLGIRKCTGDSIYSFWDANHEKIENVLLIPPKYPKGRKALNRYIKNHCYPTKMHN